MELGKERYKPQNPFSWPPLLIPSSSSCPSFLRYLFHRCPRRSICHSFYSLMSLKRLWRRDYSLGVKQVEERTTTLSPSKRDLEHSKNKPWKSFNTTESKTKLFMYEMAIYCRLRSLICFVLQLNGDRPPAEVFAELRATFDKFNQTGKHQ